MMEQSAVVFLTTSLLQDVSTYVLSYLSCISLHGAYSGKQISKSAGAGVIIVIGAP